MLGELEYMGQAEPVPTTEPIEPIAPTDETGMGDVEFEVEIVPPESGQQEEPLNVGIGSLVMPTEDPDKQ